VADVLGYKYYYDDFNEHTGRVTVAQHVTGQNPSLDRSQTSSSLDRSYEYDHVGRLAVSHAGAEARPHSFTESTSPIPPTVITTSQTPSRSTATRTRRTVVFQKLLLSYNPVFTLLATEMSRR
jgi:hypothetical protein